MLLVEDNLSTLMIMSRLLRQKLNFDVAIASFVADALRVHPHALYAHTAHTAHTHTHTHHRTRNF